MLGLALSDGCLYKEAANRHPTFWFKLELKFNDYKTLDQILSFCQSNHPLTFSQNLSGFWPVCRFVFINDAFGDDLIQLGCVQRKAAIVKFPKFIDENLMPHFLRGYLEGDGSISLSSTGVFSVKFYGNKAFLKDLVSFVASNYNVTSSQVHIRPDSLTSAMVAWSKASDVSKLLNLMYDMDMDSNKGVMMRKFKRCKFVLQNLHLPIKQRASYIQPFKQQEDETVHEIGQELIKLSRNPKHPSLPSNFHFAPILCISTMTTCNTTIPERID